jgi:CHASE3 domain sensor protein
MPFRAELAAAHEEEERLRRRRYLRYLVVIGLLTLAAVGLVVWLVGDTRQTVDDLIVEVDKVQATQEEIQKTPTRTEGP